MGKSRFSLWTEVLFTAEESGAGPRNHNGVQLQLQRCSEHKTESMKCCMLPRLRSSCSLSAVRLCGAPTREPAREQDSEEALLLLWKPIMKWFGLGVCRAHSLNCSMPSQSSDSCQLLTSVLTRRTLGVTGSGFEARPVDSSLLPAWTPCGLQIPHLCVWSSNPCLPWVKFLTVLHGVLLPILYRERFRLRFTVIIGWLIQ